MEHAAVDELDNDAMTADVTKRLTDALGLSDMAINYYELAPGEAFSGGLHTHSNQEEVFYVMAGTATFETLDDEHEVGAGEAIRFDAGEYQQGRNEGDERVRALALGAPQDSGEGRVPQPCEACGDADYHVINFTDAGITLECPACGNEIEG